MNVLQLAGSLQHSFVLLSLYFLWHLLDLVQFGRREHVAISIAGRGGSLLVWFFEAGLDGFDVPVGMKRQSQNYVVILLVE